MTALAPNIPPLSFDYDSPDIVTISHSSLANTLRTCPRKFQLRKLMQLGLSDPSPAGDAGNAMHAAWYTYLRGGSEQDAAWTLIQKYPYRFQKSMMEQRSLQSCSIALEHLLNSNLMANYELARVNTPTGEQEAIEVPFAIHILTGDGTPFYLDAANQRLPLIYIGYIDAIVYDWTAQAYRVVDLKTTTKQMTDYAVMFQFDTQCLPYALVLERMMGAPIANLEVTYAVVYIDPLEPQTLGLRFQKNNDDIQEWVRDLAMMLRDMRIYYETDWWPRRQRACTGFNICRYARDICGARNDEYIRSVFEAELAANNEQPHVRPPFHPWFQVDLRIGGLQ